MPLSIQDTVAVLRWPDVMLVRSCISANMHLINRITLYSDAPTQYLSFNQNRFWYSFGVMWPSNFGGSTHLWQTNCASYEQWTGSPVWGLLSHNVICSFVNVVCHSESPNSAMLLNHTPKIAQILMLCQANAATLMPFSKEDKILIKNLYECKGDNAWQFITEFPDKHYTTKNSISREVEKVRNRQCDAYFSSLKVMQFRTNIN